MNFLKLTEEKFIPRKLSYSFLPSLPLVILAGTWFLKQAWYSLALRTFFALVAFSVQMLFPHVCA
jgi:hypothetical protein